MAPELTDKRLRSAKIKINIDLENLKKYPNLTIVKKNPKYFGTVSLNVDGT